MRVPLSWLKEYVDITLPVEELAERMTMAGLEVAATERVGAEWDRDKLVVGQVVEVKPHPNADRLVIAMVDDGRGKPLVAVTGAPNVKVGDRGLKVPFARLGATLIDGHSEEYRLFTVQPAVIRGMASEGVVCSEKELGLSDDHTGVMILDDDAPVGMSLADYLGDVVLDLDLTPNLARCLSMIGVAREVAALTGQKLRVTPPEMTALGPPIEGQIELEIADPDLCPRYSATLIRGVQIGPSPRWMQRRLTLAGMRPVNNIVDITNYVMLEWGQPLHAFDYDRLPQKRIVVRRARPGESITTLDGVHRALTEDMLLITTGEEPVAIAGVMGGANTEVGAFTKNILLESANFDFISNRRTAQALKLPSEASARFGRGVDPELTIPAVKRASELMRVLAGGTIARGIADAYPRKPPVKHIELTTAEVERILGMEVSIERITRILKSLEFEVEMVQDQSGEGVGPRTSDFGLLVTVPSHRLDVSIPADLIEEIARIIGYDHIPATLMDDTLPPQRRNRALEGEERVRDILVGCGLTEVITYSLTNPQSEARLYPLPAEAPTPDYIRLTNPISSDRVVMRRTLMSSLLENLRLNLKHTDRVTIFEIGRVYLPREGEKLPQEPRRLALAMTGPRHARSWLTPSAEEMDFYDLKGVVETLLARLHLTDWEFAPAQHPTFHPGRAARLMVDGRELGVLGEVHPLVRAHFDLPDQRICLLELDLEGLLAVAERAHYYQPISRFPAVTQDIALVVDEDVPAQRVEDLIVKAGGKLLREVTLFDLYRGAQIPEGKKSLAYALTFQADDRTLTDEEVAELQRRIQRRLEEEIGARLRG
ncbi:MAG: phenylalanine--tRNA ligase subunit beta [Anaerolineae bacterium]